MKHTIQLTAVVRKGEDDWLVGQLQEISEVISQGRTVDELKENLLDAFQLVLEFRKASGIRQYPVQTHLQTIGNPASLIGNRFVSGLGGHFRQSTT